MKNFDCLSKSHNILAPHFLKASAGTGKTFAIEHIVTRLIVEKDIDIRNILVVTFTKAATRELKQRIRNRLEISLKILQGKVQDSVTLYLQNLSEKDKALYIENLLRALCFFDESRVFTIHGFCYRELSEGSFESKSSNLSSFEENQYVKILKDEIFHTLKADVSQKLFSPYQLDIYFKSLNRDLGKITKKLLNLLEKDAVFPSFPYYEEFATQFHRLLILYKKDILEGSFQEDLEKLGKVFKGLCKRDGSLQENYLKQIELLKALILESFSYDKIDELLETGPLFLTNLSEKFLKKKQSFNPETIKSYSSFLQMKESFLDLYQEAIDPTVIELKLAKLCFDRAQKALEALEIFSPDDILKRMKSSLEKEVFRTHVQAKYRAAIIDEFQDTDPIQWHIFSRLFNPEKDFPLYLIGDPKQSIYGFRNADLKSYLEAEKCFSITSRYSLDTNFRSDLTIIETLNVLFSKQHAKNWLSEDGSLEYTDVKSFKNSIGNEYNDQKKAVHFGVFEEKKTLGSFPSQELEETKIFPWIVKEIYTLSKQKIAFQDIAILIKDRYQAQRLETYLQKSLVPCFCKNTSHIANSKAFHFIKALFLALARPFDKSFTKLLLAHPFMGFSHIEIKEETTAFIKAISELRKLSKIIEEQGFSDFWVSFWQTSFCKKDFLSNLLESFEEQHYHDLCRLGEILLEECLSSENSVEKYIEVLNYLTELEEGENDKVKRPQLCSSNAVQILTTHMSKGLEFEIVFALGTSSRSRFSPKIIKVKKDHFHYLQAFKKEDKIHQGELKSQNFEKSRLLYVALTRAKTRLYIPVCFEEDSKASDFEKSPIELFVEQLSSGLSKQGFIDKLQLFEKQLALSYEVIDNSLERMVMSNQEQKILERTVKPFSAKIHTDYINSFSSLTHYVSKEHESYASIKDSEKSLLLMPPSKETGIIVHSLLEKVFERGLYLCEDSEKLQAFVSSQLKLTHLEGYEEIMVGAIKKLTNLSLLKDKPFLSLKNINLQNMMSETEFFFLDENLGKMKGYIDLIISIENTFYIIDWKTNYLGESAEAYKSNNMKKAMIENRYDFQASLYAKALMLHLKNFKNIHFGGVFYIFLRALETSYDPVVFLSKEDLGAKISYV